MAVVAVVAVAVDVAVVSSNQRAREHSRRVGREIFT